VAEIWGWCCGRAAGVHPFLILWKGFYLDAGLEFLDRNHWVAQDAEQRKVKFTQKTGQKKLSHAGQPHCLLEC
jgi:hypothetical protein